MATPITNTTPTAAGRLAGLEIRWMIRRDMPAVLQIENDCFDRGLTTALNEEQIVGMLRQRNMIGMAAELQGQVVGFMLYEIHRSYLNVVDFAVAPAMHRRGIGRAMVDKLRSRLDSGRRHSLRFLVAEYNTDCHLFLRACGLRCERILANCYDDIDMPGYEFFLRFPPEHSHLDGGWG